MEYIPAKLYLDSGLMSPPPQLQTPVVCRVSTSTRAAQSRPGWRRRCVTASTLTIIFWFRNWKPFLGKRGEYRPQVSNSIVPWLPHPCPCLSMRPHRQHWPPLATQRTPRPDNFHQSHVTHVSPSLSPSVSYIQISLQRRVSTSKCLQQRAF